jgi:predicted dehydrogenase
MSNQLRWGVVGCGVIASQMADALALEGRNFSAVCSAHYDHAREFASRHGISRVVSSVEEMAESSDIDAIYLATPHNRHIDGLRVALGAGKHVLCEKSITLNSDEFDEALGLAENDGLVLMEGMTIYHMPLFKELRRKLAAGEFGRVNLVQTNFGSAKPYDPSNRFFNPDLAGGALLDIGVYALSMARHFMEGGKVDVVSLENLAPTGVDEASGIVARNASGQMAVASLTLRSKQPKRAVISCDQGFVEVMEYPRACKATFTRTSDGSVETICAGESDRALLYEVEDFERAVAGEGDQTFLDETSDVQHVMTELRRSWGVSYPGE